METMNKTLVVSALFAFLQTGYAHDFSAPEPPPTPDYSKNQSEDLVQPGIKNEKLDVEYPSAKKRSHVTPIMISRPKYPAKALADKISGSVELEFTVTKKGEVVNLKVVDSTPAGVFDASVMKAMSNIRFAPRITDGRRVATDGVRAMYLFQAATGKVSFISGKTRLRFPAGN